MSMQLMHDSIFLLVLITKIAVADPTLAKNNCTSRCGTVRIPYPFGIGSKCFLNPWFEISCNYSSNPPKVFLTKIQMEVLNISLETSYSSQYVRVRNPVISENCTDRKTSKPVNFSTSPFFYSDFRNKFVAAGCDNRALIAGIDPAIVGCDSRCSGQRFFGPLNETCNGETCCEAVIPSRLQLFNATFGIKKAEKETESGGCKLAFLVEQNWFDYNLTNHSMVQSMEFVPALLNWGIALESLGIQSIATKEYSCFSYSETNLTLACICGDGYEGNPYLPNGCQDIDECKDPNHNPCGKATCVNRAGSYDCERRKFWIILGISLGFGVLLLFIGGWQLYKFLKKRRKMKLKKKFFKRNGGLLLQQQMFSSEGGIKKAKIFNSKELDKATDNFNKNRILGQGGQGTVYKGMLVDGQIVAVKKSIIMDADKVEEFINEVVILSQINHRNVVKLLGCCLETEVPLLVYEFISNGTLFQYLHDQNEEFQLSWEMRLRIATEAAEALSYLHSSASLPIYHRDIKSSNILLDEKYKAKVSDFGTSRSLAIEQTHLTTNVQGTFGYLDPEYFQSSQFSEKSDVYSFGVVLVELIVGQKPTSIIKVDDEGRSLATHFILSLQENKLFDIVDPRIMQESAHKEIIAAAKLAYRCISLSGKNRPTMREVAAELERLPSLQKALNAQQTHEEVECVITNMSYSWGATSTSAGSAFDDGIVSSLEMQPFIYTHNR
ncbi:hypothetical protein DITRI_Ditri20bG0132600 [Diplodiscus trichospermus]